MTRKIILIVLMCLFLVGLASAATCAELGNCIGTCNGDYCSGTETISETFYVSNTMDSTSSDNSALGEFQLYFWEMSTYKNEFRSLTFYTPLIEPDPGVGDSKLVTQCRWSSVNDPNDYFYANVGYVKIVTAQNCIGAFCWGTDEIWQFRVNGVGNFSSGFETLSGEQRFRLNSSSCVWNGTGLTPDRRLEIASFNSVENHGVMSFEECKNHIKAGIGNYTLEDNIVFLVERDLGDCYGVEYYDTPVWSGINILSQRSFINNYTWNVSSIEGESSYFGVTKNISGAEYNSLWNISHKKGYTLESSENAINISPLMIDTRWYCFDVRSYGIWVENDTCVGYYTPVVDYTQIATGGSGIRAPDNDSLAVCEAFINVIPETISQDSSGMTTIPWEYQTDTRAIETPWWDWHICLYSMYGNQTGKLIFCDEELADQGLSITCTDGLSDVQSTRQRLGIGDYKLVFEKKNGLFGWNWEPVSYDRFSVLPYDVTESSISWDADPYYTTTTARLDWYAVNVSNITVYYANDTLKWQYNETITNQSRYVTLEIGAGEPEGTMQAFLRDNNTGAVLPAFTEVIDIRRISNLINFEADEYAWGENVIIGFSCLQDVTMTITDGGNQVVHSHFKSPLTAGDTINFTLPLRDHAIENKTSAGTWTVYMYNSTGGVAIASDTTVVNDYNVSDKVDIVERPNAFDQVEDATSWSLGIDGTFAGYVLGAVILIGVLYTLLKKGADDTAVFISAVVIIGVESYINWIPPWVGLLAILGGSALFAMASRDKIFGGGE